jgi:membrane protease subunit HflC
MPITELVDVIDTQHALSALGGGMTAGLLDSPFRDIDTRLIDARNERIRGKLLGTENGADDLQAKALAEYGIQIIDIRVRRFSYPPAVRSSIAERIRSERAKKVADYESEGRKRASDIVTDAERQARTIEATAKAEKTIVVSKAKTDAALILASAYEQDRDFYLFLESLRSFRKILENSRDLLLLSTKHPLLKPVLDGPPKPMAPMPKEK